MCAMVAFSRLSTCSLYRIVPPSFPRMNTASPFECVFTLGTAPNLMTTLSPPFSLADEMPAAQKAARTIAARERISVLRMPKYLLSRCALQSALPLRMRQHLPPVNAVDQDGRGDVPG